MTLVDEIVELEWDFFQHVRNKGGRANCQDDYKTFTIMRKSQFETWNEELQTSYYNDLVKAVKNNWNPVMEKYARMMEYTHKAEYDEIKHILPKVADETKEIIDMIVLIQVGWMEEFSKEYPRLANNARKIHAYEDSEVNTSYETYLRAELMTYSPQTIYLYGRMVIDCKNKKENLTYKTMSITAKYYGYAMIEEAENSL